MLRKKTSSVIAAGAALAIAACGAVAAERAESSASATADAAAPSEEAAADAPRGRPETCNDLDDDLDGKIDEGCPLRLTRDGADDFSPTLSGGRVAWQRSSRKPDGGTSSSIFMRELASDAKESLLVPGGRAPSLSGNRIAFLRDHSIVVRNLDDGSELEVWTFDGTLYGPVLTSDLVVWYQIEKNTEEDYEVYAFDLKTKVVRQVAPDSAIQSDPRAFGSRIVWMDDRRGHHTIALMHLFDVFMQEGTSEPRALTNRSGDLQIGSVAAVDARYVLFTELRGPVLPPNPAQCVPILLEVASGARRELAAPSYDCVRGAALAQDWAVLEQEPEGVADLVLVDLSSFERRRVTNNPRRSTRPVIEGASLVWQDDRNDNWELYFMDLSDARTGDFAPEGVRP